MQRGRVTVESYALAGRAHFGLLYACLLPGGHPVQEYAVNCWNCLGEYDVLSAVWCSCNPSHPTKVCPFCLQCFCHASEDYMDRFWRGAPASLIQDRDTFAGARGPLGEALIRAKAITADQLLLALKEQKQSGHKLGEVLVEMGFIPMDTLQHFLDQQKSVQQLSLKDAPLEALLIASIGAAECLKHLVVPVGKEVLSTKEILTLAMAHPGDGAAIDFVQNVTGCQVLPMQATEEEIRAVLAPFIQEPSTPAGAASANGLPAGAGVAMDLIRKALARNVSDLHVEPGEREVAVHMRIDGILYRAKSVPREQQSVLTEELKRLLRLDPEVANRPQEGRVVMRAENTRFDVIAHSLPTRFGENLSLKLINRDTFLKSFEQLGLPPEDQLHLRAALSATSGLVLVSAPLFHGCTTTLYSAMAELAKDKRRKVVSIEAHNICPIPEISQISVGSGGGDGATMTTLKALGTIQPDVLVLGDLLDSASMAAQVQRFMGQMLTVSTLESGRTLQAVNRLLDLGMGAPELAQSLQAVLNQRLVRQVCPTCAKDTTLSLRSLTMMGLTEEEAAQMGPVRQGQGCEGCSGLGYRGRLALFETLMPSPAFRKALAKRSSEKVLEREAFRGGTGTLRTRAIEAIQQGLTTLEEFQKGNF